MVVVRSVLLSSSLMNTASIVAVDAVASDDRSFNGFKSSFVVSKRFLARSCGEEEMLFGLFVAIFGEE